MICTRMRRAARGALSLVLSAQFVVPGSAAAAQGGRDLQVEELVQEQKDSAALWVLAIGVSDYQDQRISLKYADNDAVTVAAMLKSQEGLLFREVFVKTLVNAEATRGEILRAMSQFLGQASQDDVVLVFLAGHGLQDRQTGSYYFVPYNANAENLSYEGLPMAMFEEAVKRIRANVDKLVLWLDTCHAGAMTVASRGVNTGEDLAEALANASGQYILSASKAGEESLEDETYLLEGEERAHGAFTFSLLRGLQGAAANESGVVWMSDLFGHVSREVPRLTNGRQHPYSSSEGTDLPLFVMRAGSNVAVQQLAVSEGGSIVLMPAPPQREGGKKWPWLLLAVALAGAGGGAYVRIGGGGGGGGAAGAISPPPPHP